MSYETITYELEKGVVLLTLNRPKSLNALNGTMVHELMDAQQRFAKDDDARVMVVTGAGRAFSAGFDLKESDASDKRKGVLENKALLQLDFEMIMGFWHSPKPTIAAVHGYCLAGACEIALACDITIAGEDSFFGEPELRFGAGIVAMLMPWMTGPKQAKELLFTGNDRVPAKRALDIGIINKVVPAGEHVNEAKKMAREIAVMDKEAVVMTKEAIHRAYDAMGMRQALQHAVDIDVQITSLDTPDRMKFREVSKKDGLKAALAWRESRFAK
ncbi:MAG: enoyl-CoA hydratase/isomerase family protein [Alphaproteobacteria bacterium]